VTPVPYPAAPGARTRWILDRRGPRVDVQPHLPHAFFAEPERTENGELAQVATVLLVGRECPWKCLMCDLWRNTTVTPTLPGAIPAQIAHALAHLPQCSVLKLYNAGSFFDPAAVPLNDWPAIADLCRGFERVILECHPRLVGPRVLQFAQMLDAKLEIAMGLETAHPASLDALNKRFTTADYASAARFLRSNDISVRTFLLVHPPFIPAGEKLSWLLQSLNFAFDSGSQVASLLPLRHGNGAIDFLAPEPQLSDLELAQERGLALKRGRVFADTWDLARFARCASCSSARIDRISRMNHSQRIEPRVPCSCREV
jgi:archaeosine synthase beta-subunit